MAEQSQQETFAIALAKDSVDTDQNTTSNINVENEKVTTKNENSEENLEKNLLEDNKNSDENKIDTNSINDMTSSTDETVNKKENENPEENLSEDNKSSDKNKIDTNSINDMNSSTSETVNKKENENPKENLSEDNKNSDENKSDNNLIDTNSSPTIVNKEVTVEGENPEENLSEDNKNLDENKSDTNLIDTNSSPTIVNREVTEGENPEENLSEDNKNSDENKSDTNLIGTNSSPTIVNREVTVEDENPEENLSEENKNLGDTNSNNDATNSTSPTGETVDIAIPQKKKKKKKKKKKTGDDDASLDFHDSGPKEADENFLYDPSKSLTYRVEIAVQKYRKNRKFTPTRNQVFNSYLRFGGISTGPKSFLGQDGLDNPDADSEEIAARRAIDYVDDEVDDMEVNFTYIVRVYLSSFLIDKSGYVQMDQFREGPQVVISFLNYLINHRVCPEYEEDMKEALKIANKAKDELPNCKALAQNAPGKLNKACSLLFGGELYGMLDNPWNGEEKVASMIGISKEEGKQLLKELFGANAIGELTQVKEDTRTAFTCEIIGVEPFQTTTSEASTDEIHQNSNGENHVDTSEDSTNETHQSTNGENPAMNNSESHSNHNGNTQETNLKKIMLREYDVSTAEPFYITVGSDLGNYAMPKMRITADFHKLSNGFWYWDKVTNVYPSYYQPCEDDSDDDD